MVVFIEIEETLVNREKIETGRFDLSATVIDLDPRRVGSINFSDTRYVRDGVSRFAALHLSRCNRPCRPRQHTRMH